MARGFTGHPVHPVSNGIDLEFDPPTLPKRHHPGAERSVVYVGRLSPEKRPEDLLEIARHLSIHTRLTVVGDGPMRRQLAATCRLLGIDERVAFVGFVDEPTKAALLDDAEVFLMPSPTELQSIATLEAMAHGCAVVAAGFPTSAVPSLVRESGAGRIYAPGRFVEVAETIDGLLDDQERLLAYQRNALRAVRRHDVMESGRILAALYAGLTQQAPRRGSRSWTRARSSRHRGWCWRGRTRSPRPDRSGTSHGRGRSLTAPSRIASGARPHRPASEAGVAPGSPT